MKRDSILLVLAMSAALFMLLMAVGMTGMAVNAERRYHALRDSLATASAPRDTIILLYDRSDSTLRVARVR